MRIFLGVALVLCAYVAIDYRLLVKHHYERQYGVRESAFGALFSFPPYGRLSPAGRKYARRYWLAIAAMCLCLVAAAVLSGGTLLSGVGPGGA